MLFLLCIPLKKITTINEVKNFSNPPVGVPEPE
jgi:hypothetical protein